MNSSPRTTVLAGALAMLLLAAEASARESDDNIFEPSWAAFGLDLGLGYPVSIGPSGEDSVYRGLLSLQIRHGWSFWALRFGMGVQAYCIQNRAGDDVINGTFWAVPFFVSVHLMNRSRLRVPLTIQVGPAQLHFPGIRGHGGGTLYSVDLQWRWTLAQTQGLRTPKSWLILAPTVEVGRIGRKPDKEVGGLGFVAARIALAWEIGEI
jgi:hypothetical protein